MYEVRVYQGDSVRTMPLDAAEGMSFGEDKKCSCAFPKGSCPGASVRLLCENGVWKAECAGPVLHNGKQAQTAMVQNGDMLILNQDSHLAVQLVFRGEKPAATPRRALADLYKKRAALSFPVATVPPRERDHRCSL